MTLPNLARTRRSPPSKREPRPRALPNVRSEGFMRSFRILAALAVLAIAASAQAPPAPQQNPPASQQAGATPSVPPQPAPAAQQTPASISPIKTNTRLITVDVVVTDSHGNVVRGLKPEDFQVSEEHAGPQKIVEFDFVDAQARPATAPPGAPLAA